MLFEGTKTKTTFVLFLIGLPFLCFCISAMTIALYIIHRSYVFIEIREREREFCFVCNYTLLRSRHRGSLIKRVRNRFHPTEPLFIVIEDDAFDMDKHDCP